MTCNVRDTITSVKSAVRLSPRQTEKSTKRKLISQLSVNGVHLQLQKESSGIMKRPVSCSRKSARTAIRCSKSRCMLIMWNNADQGRTNVMIATDLFV